MNNLVQRTISGVVLVALLVGSVLWNAYSFGILFVLITAMAVHEFHQLSNRQGQVSVNQICAIIGGVLLFCCSFLFTSGVIPALQGEWRLFLIYALFSIFVLISELYRKKEQPIHNWAYFFFGQIFTALPFSLLNFILFIPTYRPIILLAVFVTIWVNDTGAYLTGMTLGKHRLFERISPKKSWEGFFGGALFALLSGYVFSRFVPEISLWEWFIFSEIIVVFGTFGDLIESLLKRTLQVKDSGNTIPGHGGLLDRFDSMLLAAPAIFMYLTVISGQ